MRDTDFDEKDLSTNDLTDIFKEKIVIAKYSILKEVGFFVFSIVSPERLISRPFEFADKCLIPQSLAGYDHQSSKKIF